MSIGVVVIGRNEGNRLKRCIESVMSVANKIVYVDSGSTDGSVAMALGMGLGILELDMQVPFTAARARNEGFKQLLKSSPELDYIQFVDGDCELVEGWLGTASTFMDIHKNVAVTCGRLRERFPQQSIYNQLCDNEWDTAIGLTKTCGGIAMMRKDAFATSGGFRQDLIAGEESELCVRLRASAWQIWRVDAEMALHDAAMTHFSQWWKRTVRSGYAYAEGAFLHGKPPERHCINETRRILIWGGVIPLLVLSLTIGIGIAGLLLLLIYPVQIIRLAMRGDGSTKQNFLRGMFLVIGKFPEVIGQFKFLFNRLFGKRGHLIEYK